MIDEDTIAQYLPCYLSSESKSDLLKNLSDFPNDIDSRMYTTRLQNDEIIYQGDGLKDFPIIRLPDEEIRKSNVMVLSNTCDLSLENSHLTSKRMCYAPLFSLNKYISMLKNKLGKSEISIQRHIDDIKKQRISHMFFLPRNSGIEEDSIVFLDTIVNHNNLVDGKSIPGHRLFTLSDYGFYLFIFKLSIHFTRLQEGVDRRIA